MTSSDQNKVVRGPLVGALATVFGQRFWGLERNETGLTLLAHQPQSIDFFEMSGPVRTARHFGLMSVSVPLADGAVIRVAGLKPAGLASFVETTNHAWRRTASAAFDASLPELEALAEVVARLATPRRYPAACALQPFFQRASSFVARFPKAEPTPFLSIGQLEKLNLVLDFHKQPERLRAAAIDAFINAELDEMADFFDSVESHPLTPEQRRAVVTDEDATLVLAGAGSGKTSVIVAKAAYLIERGIRRPQDILLLAFGKEVVEHVYAPRDYARTLYDLLEPGGLAIISTPYHGYWKNLAFALSGKMDAHFTALWDHGHIKFWSTKTLGALLREVGFEQATFQRVGRVPALAMSMIAVAKKPTA